MKKFVLFSILVISLAACAAEKPVDTPVKGKRAVFYKEKATDAQMTNDLNECAYRVLKSEIQSESIVKSKRKVLTKKDCMVSLGYNVTYN